MNRLSEHFTVDEFKCHCCGRCEVDPRLIEALEELRTKLGKPIIITSGYRCREHNTQIHGASQSQHCLGKAADIKVKDMSPSQIKEVAETIELFRKGGIGLYQTWLHLDIRPYCARWIS